MTAAWAARRRARRLRQGPPAAAIHDEWDDGDEPSLSYGERLATAVERLAADFCKTLAVTTTETAKPPSGQASAVTRSRDGRVAQLLRELAVLLEEQTPPAPKRGRTRHPKEMPQIDRHVTDLQRARARRTLTKAGYR